MGEKKHLSILHYHLVLVLHHTASYLTLVRGKKRQPARHGTARRGTARGAGLNDWKSSPQDPAAVSKQRERSTPPEEELRGEDCAHLSASSEQLQRRRWQWQHRLSRPTETTTGLTTKQKTKTKMYVCTVQINEGACEWESPLQCKQDTGPRSEKTRPVYLAEAGERRQTAALPARQLHAAEEGGLTASGWRRSCRGYAAAQATFPLVCFIPHHPPAPPCLFCVMTPPPAAAAATTF